MGYAVFTLKLKPYSTDSLLAMPNFTDIHLQPAVLTRYGLPDIAYPVASADQKPDLCGRGELPLAMMLHGLQERTRDGSTEWKQYEPAMNRLAELMAPADGRDVITATGDNWWVEIGPVDLRGKLVTVQRGDDLIAVITPRKDFRLRVAVFRPLDAKSAEYLTGLGQVPHPEHGVCMRENNWEYALDCSAGNGNYYASERGEAYLSYWEKGLGINWDGTEVPEWCKQLKLAARPAAQVVVDLGVHHSLPKAVGSEAEDATEGAEPVKAAYPPVWRSKRQQRRTVQARFVGCLLGGAVGDALGAPVEFMKRTDILRRFGPEGITQYAPAYGGIGLITDDTQMTLFTAEGLIRAWVRGCMKGITTYSGVTAHAYLRWLQTQGERPTCDIAFGSEVTGWLFQQRDLHNRRAPGNTCLSALRAMGSLGEPARNDSKGCGGVMRVSPVGLFAWRLDQQKSPQAAFRLGTELAALTHGHPTGALTGGVLAVLILALTDGVPLPEALAASKTILCAEPEHDETLRAIERAETLAASGMPHNDAIAQIGQGWVAEEALAISIYCALVARNFKHGVILAVNHDGDSDSTGSITGNLLGAMLGVKAIPSEWLEPLELREVITDLANDLYSFKDWDIGEYSENEEMNQCVWQKYPGF
jgi:ADP-ribosylglycohydrolase